VNVNAPATDHPIGYISLVLAVAVGAGVFGLRLDNLFACQAAGYGADRYLAYCQATSYGDYDHGAFWFGLERSALDAAASADVLFLGNSRMEFGFSTDATTDWFSSSSTSYYLLGFSHNGNYTFEAPLLRKLQPRAKAYVINIDLFFEPAESPPARTVMHDVAAAVRYRQKEQWQRAHKLLCGRVPFACRDEIAFFRSRTTGAWRATGAQLQAGPVSYDASVNQATVGSYRAAGSAFLSNLPVNRGCVVLTLVPTTTTNIGTAKAIAAAVGVTLIAPELDGLRTFDGSHLDRASAERWSGAFVRAAGSWLHSCL
jgi:hypothetical protein